MIFQYRAAANQQWQRSQRQHAALALETVYTLIYFSQRYQFQGLENVIFLSQKSKLITTYFSVEMRSYHSSIFKDFKQKKTQFTFPDPCVSFNVITIHDCVLLLMFPCWQTCIICASSSRAFQRNVQHGNLDEIKSYIRLKVHVALDRSGWSMKSV